MNYYTTVKQDPNLVYANFTGSDLASSAGKAVAELCYEGVYLISGAPTNTPNLYIPGAIVHNAIDGNNYENKGTTASPNFQVMATGSGITALTGDVTASGPGSAVAAIAANAITTAKILNANVTLAKLAVGITPSHVVKFAGKITWSGSGASLATTITGILSTDIVIASIQGAPTQAAYLVSAAPTTNTLTLVLSAANTSNNAIISYSVLRAAV